MSVTWALVNYLKGIFFLKKMELRIRSASQRAEAYHYCFFHIRAV